MEEKIKSPKDKYILFIFLAFFGLIFAVDSFFVYTAVTTQTGVVTEKAYEVGLNYNELLQEAKDQPELQDRVTFENGALRWDLNDKGINNAEVKAKIVRPIQDGHDFDIVLENKGSGVYEAPLDLPFKGLWEAKLSGKWNNKTYKTTHQFLVK